MGLPVGSTSWREGSLGKHRCRKWIALSCDRLYSQLLPPPHTSHFTAPYSSESHGSGNPKNAALQYASEFCQ